MAGSGASDRDDYFKEWVTRYAEFYPVGSRLDKEFRASRMVVLAGRSWTHRIDYKLLQKTGQTRARWQVLFAIAFAEQPVTMSELCRRNRVTWPTMVRVIQSMERDGLLRREDHPEDKRSRYIYLTDEGERIMRQIQPVLDQERALVLAGLSDAELEQVRALLHRVFKAAIS